MQFHHDTLDNGLNVIAELNDSVHSVAVGFFVRAGSRDEAADVSGVSHFLEHMAFKGNDNYTADDVNRIFDEIGARYNASTSEEVTLYYGAILPEFLDKAFEMLATLIYPSLRQEDFDIEKNVILEEIGMYEDQPAFTAYEKSMSAHFDGHPLGHSILGSKESITELTSEQMRDYHARQYRAGNVTLAVAGNTTFEKVMELAEKWCGKWTAGQSERDKTEARPSGGVHVVQKDSSRQQHVMQMGSAPSAESNLRYAAQLLAVVVGDDSGSRLYWEIVDHGHAEAAELGFNEYDGSGTWLSYLSCQPEEVDANLARMAEIYRDVNENGITEEELEQARNKVASQIVLRSERPMGRLSSLGGNWVYRGEYRSVADDLETCRSVSMDDIQQLLKKYPLTQTTTLALGPAKELAFQEA
jgi:predicted Zn-dependent peptidase